VLRDSRTRYRQLVSQHSHRNGTYHQFFQDGAPGVITESIENRISQKQAHR